MKDAVYLYFADAMLTNGSYEDLRKLDVEPKEGLRLTFYDMDGDDQNRPAYLCAEGTLYSVTDVTTAWYAEIDESTFRTVPRSVITD